MWIAAVVSTACGSEPAKPATETTYFVSIGDSYAAGDSPYGTGAGSKSTDGFAYRTESALRRNVDEQWRLINFGCSGATAQQMVHQPGCDVEAKAHDGPAYDDVSQVDAAVQFISDHREQVGLVTIVAGGNDVAPCIAEAPPDGVLACSETATESATAALDDMLGKLGGVLDAGVPVVGLSYLNVFVAGEHAEPAAAVFDGYFNPALRESYSRSGARFVEPIATSVDEICALSYYCSDDDPHPNGAGHQRIADDVLQAAGIA